MKRGQKWYPVKPEFKCARHGVVEPRQIPEDVREFGNCTMTVVRMECPICGSMVARDDPQWKELRELMGK
jgi:hypothetical protein